MPSLISKLTLRVAEPIAGSKKYYRAGDPDVTGFRGHDVKTPRAWMTPGCTIESGYLGELPNHSVVPKRQRHPDRVLLYLHGGAYVTGPLFWHWWLCGSLARRSGVRVELPDYPLAPESECQQTVGAVVGAYEDLLRRYEPHNITIAGDSAGGGLTAALSLELTRRGIAQPGRLILISPWVDLVLDDPAVEALDALDPLLSPHGLRVFGSLYAGGADAAAGDLASPVNGDLSMLPPTHVFGSDHDVLAPSIREFARRAHKQGADVHFDEFDGQIHVWVAVPVIPEAADARGRIAALIAG